PDDPGRRPHVRAEELRPGGLRLRDHGPAVHLPLGVLPARGRRWRLGPRRPPVQRRALGVPLTGTTVPVNPARTPRFSLPAGGGPAPWLTRTDAPAGRPVRG